MEINHLLTRGLVNSGIAAFFFINSSIEMFNTGHELLGILSALALLSALYDIYLFHKTSADIFNNISKGNKNNEIQ